MALPKLELIHGVEKQFFTNHVGHFLLITGLLDNLTDDGRVVILSSALHLQAPKVGIDFANLDGSKRYAPWESYAVSKLANVLFANSLARKFEGTNKRAFSVHPGVILTNLIRYQSAVLRFVFSNVIGPLFLKSIPQGAATSCFAAVHPSALKAKSTYLKDCGDGTTHPAAGNVELQDKLWKETQAILDRC